MRISARLGGSSVHISGSVATRRFQNLPIGSLLAQAQADAPGRYGNRSPYSAAMAGLKHSAGCEPLAFSDRSILR